MSTTLTLAASHTGGMAAWVAELEGAAAWSGGGTLPGNASYGAELSGLVQALRAVPSGAVQVRLANETILKTATDWLPGWKARGWRKKKGSIQHLDAVKALDAELQRLDVSWQLLPSKDPALKPLKVRAKEVAQEAAQEAAERQAQAGEESAAAELRVGEPKVAAPATTRLVAWTDGGCRGNPGVGGWAYLLVDTRSGTSLEARGGARETTNNRMELLAVIEALAVLKRPGQEIEIRTDSAYVKNVGERWIAGWKRRGWRKGDGEPVINLDLVRRLDGLLQRHRVTWLKVKGHSGEPGNEHVDALANAAMDDVRARRDPRWQQRSAVAPVWPGVEGVVR